MITKPLVHEVVRHTIIPAIPSISQFASSVATKCLSFGVPCAIGVAASSFGPNTNRALGTPRGGGSSSNLDLERVGLRLSSLAEYCVISSLILGAIIGELEIVPTFFSTVNGLSALQLFLTSFFFFCRYL